MKKNDTRLLEAIDHIDEKFIAETEKYYMNAPSAKTESSYARSTRRMVKMAVAIAACLVLLCAAIPTVTIVTENIDLFSPVKGTNESENINTAPEYDGSRGLLYAVNEDGKTASFIGFGSCDDEEVFIASTYDGLPVVAMINKAYNELGENDRVYDMADYGSRHVKKLVISDTVEKINRSYFQCCPNLESIYIGASVKDMGKFWLATGLKNITRLEVSPENKYYMSKDNCIIEIATKSLFRGCKTSIIPDDGSVTKIGIMAFSCVSGLKTIVIPDQVRVIEHSAFSHCEDLESITLPKNLETLDEDMLGGCQKLVSVDLNGLTVIPDHMFYSNKLLSEVKGSENVTEIGEYAFAHCRSLTEVTLGRNLKKIGKSAFSHGVSAINYEGTMEEWNAIEKDPMWNCYTDERLVVKNVFCTDGTLHPTSLWGGRQ